jgi:hypothetical protein
LRQVREGAGGGELEGLMRELGITIVPSGEAEWHGAWMRRIASGGADTPRP